MKEGKSEWTGHLIDFSTEKEKKKKNSANSNLNGMGEEEEEEEKKKRESKCVLASVAEKRNK